MPGSDPGDALVGTVSVQPRRRVAAAACRRRQRIRSPNRMSGIRGTRADADCRSAARRSWVLRGIERASRRRPGPVALRPWLSPGVPFRGAAILQPGTRAVKPGPVRPRGGGCGRERGGEERQWPGAAFSSGQNALEVNPTPLLAKVGTTDHPASRPQSFHRHWSRVKLTDSNSSGIYVRQARIRPECAWRYPGFDRRRWYVASTIAEAIGRRLPSRHFEFRGRGRDRPPDARTRSTDPP